jgi:serine/threonine protein kinase
MEDVRFEDYSLKKRLGRGGFGTVFLAQKISNQQIVAVRLPLLPSLPPLTSVIR